MKSFRKAAMICLLFALPAAASIPASAAREVSIRTTAGKSGAGIITKSSEAQSPVVRELNVACAPSGIVALENDALLITDTYGKTVWLVQNGAGAVFSGSDSVADPYGEPVGGYNDAAHAQTLFKEPWAISPFLDGFAVSDAENNAVRLVHPARTETVNGRSNRLPMNELGVIFYHPTGLATDAAGKLYVADTHKGAVRYVTPTGRVETLIEGLNNPTGLCWHDGALYIAETGGNRILRVQNGAAELIAGSGADGYADGAAATAAFSSPQGVAVGPDGTVYVADTVNGAVRRVRNGIVDTILSQEGSGLQSGPVSPRGLCIWNGSLYICDNFARRVYILSL